MPGFLNYGVPSYGDQGPSALDKFIGGFSIPGLAVGVPAANIRQGLGVPPVVPPPRTVNSLPPAGVSLPTTSLPADVAPGQYAYSSIAQPPAPIAPPPSFLGRGIGNLQRFFNPGQGVPAVPSEPLPGTPPTGQGGIGSDARVPTKAQPPAPLPQRGFSNVTPASAAAIAAFLPRQRMPQEVAGATLLNNATSMRDRILQDANSTPEMRAAAQAKLQTIEETLAQLNSAGNQQLLMQLMGGGGIQ